MPADITGITFDFDSDTFYGSETDNFPMTWASDGRVLTSGGDGRGLLSPLGPTRSELSFHDTGDADWQSLTWRDRSGSGIPDTGETPDHPEAEHNIPGSPRDDHRGKCKGMLTIDGKTYIAVTPGSSGQGLQSSTLYRCDDDDVLATWVQGARWINPAASGSEDVYAPGLMQAGQNYADAPYPYVYMPYMHVADGGVYLARCSTANLATDFLDKSAWEFWDGSGWAATEADAAAIYTEPTHSTTDGVSLTYFKHLQQYLLIYTHSAGSSVDSNWVFAVSREPEGPYTEIARYTDDWGPAAVWRQGFYMDVASKWTSGLDIVLVWSGVNATDRLNMLAATLIQG